MIELKGKYTNAMVYTDNVDEVTVGQVIELCSQEFAKDWNIRIMPDCHAGAGCVIGTTIVYPKENPKIVPNLVGVDIGCVDKDTEFLTEKGFVKISEYDNQKLAVFNKNTKETFFELPLAYIKKEEKEFYHLKTKYGIDQMLSKEHTCLVEKGSHHKANRRGELYTLTAEELYNKHNTLALGFRDNFLCEIPSIKLNSLNSLTTEQIRVQIMIMADGHIQNVNTKRCVCRFKKERKIKRCIELLNAANIEYISTLNNENITSIYFYAPIIDKRIKYFYDSNIEQLKIICDEIKHWDFSISDNCYISKYKEDVDFVQYAFAATGYRTSINYDSREGKESYRCLISDSRPRIQIAGTPKTAINIVPSEDGYKYCFTTSTGFWIMRRNGCICVTGNCGMFCVKIAEKEIDMVKLDKTIRESIPLGSNVRDKDHSYNKYVNLNALLCKEHVDLNRAHKSIGTLGGGNHFIEIDKDDEGNLYLVIHTGSRQLGKQIAEYYQKKAVKYQKQRLDKSGEIIAKLKAEGKAKEIELALKERKNNYIDPALCYVEGQDCKDYLHDMNIAQIYAIFNREAIADTIIEKMGFTEVDHFTTIHNYIDINTCTLRKGAISAKAGEKVLIPINSADGSIIAIGKGNVDWNNSAPHGAGRIMSRSKAKEAVSLEDYEKRMEGVFTTSVSKSTIDEAPMVYKPIEEIIANIKDTVDIQSIIKPIYNLKSGEKTNFK